MNLFNTTRNTIATSLFLLVLFGSFAFAGGPWLQQKSKGFAQLSLTVIPTYDGLYNGDGDNFTLNRDVSDITTQFYAEYGLTPFLSASIEVPFKSVSTSEDSRAGSFSPLLESGSKSALGNAAIALKSGKAFNRLQAAITFKAEMPAGEADVATGLASGVDALGIVPGISLGTSGNKYYVSSDISLRFRTNDYSDDFLFAGEAGAKIGSRFWLIAAVDIRQSITDAVNIDNNLSQTGLYADGQEWIASGVKVLADITPKIGISFASFGAFDGNLVASSPSYTLGAFVRL
ncbi:MAG: hypothetical protein ACRBF0_14150 [Calditrichia bacterium]